MQGGLPWWRWTGTQLPVMQQIRTSVLPSTEAEIQHVTDVRRSCFLLPAKERKKKTHVSVLMINKEIPHLFAMQVGDLQTVSVADLLRLEHCVQVLHGDDSFGNLGLGWVAERFETLDWSREWSARREKHNSHLPWWSIWGWSLSWIEETSS